MKGMGLGLDRMKMTAVQAVGIIVGVLFYISCGPADYRPLAHQNSTISGDLNGDDDGSGNTPQPPPSGGGDQDRFKTKGTGGAKGSSTQNCEGGEPIAYLCLNPILLKWPALLSLPFTVWGMTLETLTPRSMKAAGTRLRKKRDLF